MMASRLPQQAIEDRKALGVAVQDGRLRQFDEFGRYGESALRGFERQCCRRWLEQFGPVAVHRPFHLGRRHMMQHQSASGLPPAFEIGLAVEDYEMHRTLSSRYSAVSGGLSPGFPVGRSAPSLESL